MQSKRIINFRPIFLLFIVAMFTIFFAARLNLSWYYLFCLIIPVVFFIILIIKKKYIFLIVSVLLTSFLTCYTYFYVKNYNDNRFNGQYTVISARVENIKKISDNFSYVTLSNAKATTSDYNAISLNGNITIGINCYDDTIIYDIGYYVTFATSLTSLYFFDENGEVNSFYLKENLRYEGSLISASDMAITSSEQSLTEKFKAYSQNLLIESFGETQGNLAYALLYGDKSYIESQVMNIFKYSGVVHIFSVSGLHVSLIVAIVYFVLKKFRASNILALIISTIFLGIFCFICSFSAPVVRASIMSLVVLIAKTLYRKPDPLNTLSVSGIILLFVNPIFLFDGGFQMTFTAVAGILFFWGLFQKIKIKQVWLKNLVLFIGTSVSTQLAMLPILAKYYGYVATWSIFANLITLPIFSIFYPILFITNLFVLIFPFVKFIYFLPKAMLSILIYVNGFIVSLPFGILQIKRWGLISALIYYLFMFCISKYLMLKTRYKILICNVLLIASLTFNYIYNIPYYNLVNSLVFYNSEKCSYSLITTKDNNYYMLNPTLTNAGISNIIYDLNDKKIYKLDGIIISTTQTFQAKQIDKLLDEFSCNLYLPKCNKSIKNLTQLGTKLVVVDGQKVELNNQLEFEFKYYANQIACCIFNYYGYNFATLDCNNLKGDALADFCLQNLNFYLECVKVYNCTLTAEVKNNLLCSNFLFNLDYTKQIIFA